MARFTNQAQLAYRNRITTSNIAVGEILEVLSAAKHAVIETYESYDVIICTKSFHHYPNPQDFFDSVYRVLRKGGRLILRDYTSSDLIVWLMNHIELPLAHLVGHGDVKIYKKEEYREMLKKAGFRKMKVVREEKFRCHVVAVKL